MGKGHRRRGFDKKGVAEFLSHLKVERPLLPLVVCVVILLWAIERWILSSSSLIPAAIAVWATIQYGNVQRRILVEDLNNKWNQAVLNNSPITPVEHCEWLNKLLIEVWPNYINPKLSVKFSSIVEKRLKRRKSRLIERVELQEFSLGSSPPCLGLHGTQWSTSGDQRIMRLGFLWDTNDMSIMLLAKLGKPFMGTARIVIDSIHIKGDLLLMPILEGRAILYSFVSTPEVRIGVAFGSGGSQSLPVTELPGVSSWLVKIFTDMFVETMVEPRRRCFSLPPLELRKKAVGGILYVTIVSASKLSRSSLGAASEEHLNGGDMQTFVEVELEELTRRTDIKPWSSPRWDSTFNMVLHEDTGTLRFHLFGCTPGCMKYDYLASCEIKMKYVADGSTTFWAVGSESSVIAKHAEVCGKQVEMVVPFEGVSSGELKVKLVLKEWQFSYGSHSIDNSHVTSQHPLSGSSNILPPRTGRKINIKIMEAKDLISKEKTGKCNQYVKLQYGKNLQRTRIATNASNPHWNQKFEFDEIGGGESLKIKCYNEETFGDDKIGSARVNLGGLVEGSTRDVWVPLERVNSGELRLQIQAAKFDDEASRGSAIGSGNGLIELVLIEAKDLVAADLRGTSDAYVRVQYGHLKRRTKIMHKTLNPQWNQTLEFPDNGSPLVLQVKDHNALLPTSSIGDCVVEYQRLPPNKVSHKWIPLQGVKRGEIHIQITRKAPGQPTKRSGLDSESSSTKAYQISSQTRQMMMKLQSLIEDGDVEGVSAALSELERLENKQEEYVMQLETEQMLLLDKIDELGQQIFNPPSPSSNKRSPT